MFDILHYKKYEHFHHTKITRYYIMIIIIIICSHPMPLLCYWLLYCTEPSASVSNLNATPNFNNVPNLVRIQWNHIPHDAWNGNVGGYLVSHCSPCIAIVHLSPSVLGCVHVLYICICV